MKIQKLVEETEKITDPRRQYGYLQHKLVNLVVIAFCAIICGAKDYEDIETFGKTRKIWVKKFLELPNDIPSKDTFRRVFERLTPLRLQTVCIVGLTIAIVKEKPLTLMEKPSAAAKTPNITHTMLYLLG